MRKSLLLTCLLTLVAAFGMAQETTKFPITLTTADGLPGPFVVQNYLFKSDVYTLDAPVKKLRFTVCSTNTVEGLGRNNWDGLIGNDKGTASNGQPFFTVSELRIYDKDGKQVNFAGDCNATQIGDGKGIPALSDRDETITVFALVGSNLLNFFKLRSYISFKKQEKYEFKKHLKPIFILFAQSLAISVYTNLDIIMLGFVKGDYDVGLYSAASRFKGLLVSLVTSLGNVLLPRMSHYAKHKMHKEFQSTSIMAINFTLLLSIPLAVFFIFSSSDCLLILSGSEFLGATLAMQIITIAIVPCGLTGFLGIQVLTSLEKEKYVLYSVVAGAVIDFILNCFMIPLWGASGAALATTIAEFFVLAVQLVYTKDVIRPIIRKIRIPYYLVATALSSGALLLCGFLPLNNLILRLGVTAIVFFGVYAACLFVVKEPILADPEQRPTIKGAKEPDNK